MTFMHIIIPTHSKPGSAGPVRMQLHRKFDSILKISMRNDIYRNILNFSKSLMLNQWETQVSER